MACANALRTLSVVVSMYLALAPVVQAQQRDLVLTGDITAPSVEHQALTEPATAGEPLAVSATVTDDNGVKAVTLHYRTKGEEAYKRIAMRNIAGTDMYMVTLAGVEAPGFEYYIQAEDLAGNTLLRGYDFAPLSVAVQPAAADTAVGAAAPAARPAAKAAGGANWLLIGLGVLAVGALAGGGGGGNGPPPAETVNVTIGAPIPEP